MERNAWAFVAFLYAITLFTVLAKFTYSIYSYSFVFSYKPAAIIGLPGGSLQFSDAIIGLPAVIPADFNAFYQIIQLINILSLINVISAFLLIILILGAGENLNAIRSILSFIPLIVSSIIAVIIMAAGSYTLTMTFYASFLFSLILAGFGANAWFA